MKPTCSPSFSPIFLRTWDVAVFGGGYAGFAAVQRLRAAGRTVVWLDRQAALLVEGGWANFGVPGDGTLPAWKAWCDGLKVAGAVRDGRIDGALAEVTCAALVRRDQWNVMMYVTPMAIERDATGSVAGVIVGGKSGLHRVAAAQWLDATEDGELVRLMGLVPAAPTRRRLTITRRHHQHGEEHLSDVLKPGEDLWDAWLRLLPQDHGQCVVSHGSVVPWNEWDGIASVALPGDFPSNVAQAVPGFATASLTTLSDRFASGHAAAESLLTAPRAVPQVLLAPLPEIVTEEILQAGVAVAGLGTGGALAALAAGRAGARVVGVEPLPFAGGIGSGGGIHIYYFGAKGGLQEELDQRVRAVMPRFGSGPQIPGFHPDAKKAVLSHLLRETGVTSITGTVVSVRRERRQIREALVANPTGPVRIAAAAWIDGTGDGDLCAQAGCASSFGRVGDDLPHHYSQSSGKVTVHQGVSRMHVINYDQGFTDPRDLQDLTRARLTGIAEYHRDIWSGDERPTYIAPALGLRQGRQIETRATLSLTDLIERSRVPDRIGITGCHYDNHATDYVFESDEAMFWVWACRQWRGRTACDIPYGILVPAALDNAWIASRCLGVTQDAHHSLRMQRDLQRVGEVAGLAAAQYTRCGAVEVAVLQEELRGSGALAEVSASDEFGHATDPAWLHHPGYAEWVAFRSGTGTTSTFAGVVGCALRGDVVALPPLWYSIDDRVEDLDTVENDPSLHLPQWWIAIAALRGCGGIDDLSRLAGLDLGDKPLPWCLAAILATTVGRIAERIPPSAAAPGMEVLLERCLTAVGARRGHRQGPLDVRNGAPGEDATWQLYLAVAKARAALGLTVTIPDDIADDERALVRQAFLGLAQRRGVTATAARQGFRPACLYG